ncbi:MAG: hypothetical protein GQ561_01995, partial [Calditrichae bacterium]|nr:hypothetical protein [Calditrichia bacterium]
MKNLTFFATFLFTIAFYSCSEISTPPVAEVRMVTDTLHGDVVPDPYRWLEDWNDPEVKTW